MTSPDKQDGGDGFSPSLPFPISCISRWNRKRYMLYDINLISWLRQEHHILGVLIGSLPQAPSQNVFLGLPLELMAEEAKLLVENKLAFISDDRTWHQNALRSGVDMSKVKQYKAELSRRGVEAAEAAQKAKEIKLEEVLSKLSLNGNLNKKLKGRSKAFSSESSADSSSLLFDEDDTTQPISTHTGGPESESYAITPTISGSLRPEYQSFDCPESNTSSYALFKMLHDQGYFLSPGLRFGCQYMAYPGDPLRYHSHFLAVASEWNKHIALIDIIGSGRLATGVKKCFLLGGIQPSTSEEQPAKTRAFSIEWAGM